MLKEEPLGDCSAILHLSQLSASLSTCEVWLQRLRTGTDNPLPTPDPLCSSLNPTSRHSLCPQDDV